MKTRLILPLAMVALTSAVPLLAQTQGGGNPPAPPGPYQASPNQVQVQTPTPTPTVQQSAIPAATQRWAPPQGQLLPYWMQAPAQNVATSDQGGMSPNASPNRRGGQVAPTQFSPANATAAPINQVARATAPTPYFGTRVAPGYFPGYTNAQSAGGQAHMQGGAAISTNVQAQGQTQGRSVAQPSQYPANRAYPAYPAYPAFPGYQGFQGPFPMPYWAAPTAPIAPFYPGYAPAYPAPGQVNR